MFSRYEVYSEARSMYFYPDVDILRNKLGIKSYDLLKEAENEISFLKAVELIYKPVLGRFSLSHLLNIHKYLFEDIYSFAGHIRYEDISKGETRFITHTDIKEKLKKLFEELNQDDKLRGLEGNGYFEKLAYYMAELNVIHPFREGNGRAIREFIRQLALYNGYELNWDKVDKGFLLDSSIESIYDTTNLINCLKDCCSK